MPQALTINRLVLDALILIGEYDPDEVASEGYINEGIRKANYILDEFSTNGTYIPFISTLDFTLSSNQSTYTISQAVAATINASPIVELVTCKVKDINNTTEYPVNIIEYSEVDYLRRDTGIRQRPFDVILQRGDLSSTLLFYPTPDLPYPAFIRYKAYLANLSFNQELNNIPAFFHRYFQFRLAKELSMVYPTSNWLEKHEQELQKMDERIKSSTDWMLTSTNFGVVESTFSYGYYRYSLRSV